MAQTVKNPALMRGDQGSIPELGRFPEEGMATHYRVLPRRISMDRKKPGGLQSMGSQRVRHD